MSGLFALVQGELIIIAIATVPEFIQVRARAGNEAALSRQISDRAVQLHLGGRQVCTGGGDVFLGSAEFSSHFGYLTCDLTDGLVLLVLHPPLERLLILPQL